MPSPFPGMDPYLEGYLWPDVDNALAAKIRQLLAPLLRPRYMARLAVYVVEDISPEGDIGIMYRDVEIMQADRAASTPSATPLRETPATASRVSYPPAPLTLPALQAIDVQLISVDIHDTAHTRLVTSIEILSPVNKRESGITTYRQKRHRLYHGGVHLLEIDFIRRGTRPFAHPRLPDVPYVVALTRAHTATTDVWPLSFQDALPAVPIPLNPPDEDIVLDLSVALAAIYDEAGYDLSIDYRQPPPPPELSETEVTWVRELLSSP
jgi:hypothetical protein